MWRKQLQVASLAAALATLVAWFPREANAGNNLTQLMGGRAAGMGGAYTAMADEASVAWYNPAGLGFNERYSFDVSASAFSLQSLRVTDLVTTRLPSGEHAQDFDISSFQVVPTSLSLVYRVGRPDGPDSPPGPNELRHTLAFSAFEPQAVKYSSDVELNVSDAINGVAFDYHHRLHIDQLAALYYIGPSWGMRIGPDLAVGASLFVTYLDSRSHQEFNLDYATGGQHYFVLSTDQPALTEIGLATALGVQWRPWLGLRLGLTVRPPAIRVYQRVGGHSLLAAAPPAVLDPHGSGTVSDGHLFQDQPDSGSGGVRMSAPFGATLGLAWVEPGSFSIAADVDYTMAFQNAEAGIDHGHLFNARIGAEIIIADRFALAYGAYTDLAPERGVASFAQTRLDFFGVTTALTILSPYKVVESDKTDLITFSTTIGLKYAYGFGDVGGLVMDPFANPSTAVVTTTGHVHEFSVILASSLMF